MPNISSAIGDTKILLSKNVTKTKFSLTYSKITKIAPMFSIIIQFNSRTLKIHALFKLRYDSLYFHESCYYLLYVHSIALFTRQIGGNQDPSKNITKGHSL